jgi:hypothetical protein
MTELTSTKDQPLKSDAHVPASALFIVIVLLVTLAIQVALYWPTTRALPFGDDWGVPLSEIHRGNTVGVLSFFTETRQPDSYRPIQSLLMWLFGRVEEPGRWFSIRILHFLCSAVLMGSLGLMLHAWKVGRNGVVAANIRAAVPTLVAPVGSVDGFSSTLSCAFVWIGVWAMYVTRHRPVVSILLACVALVVGTLVKEYAFALAPMAVLTAFLFLNPKWRWTLITAAALGILTFALLWMRQFVKPTDMELPPSDFAIDSPKALALNAGLVIVGGLFYGDSFGLYLDRSLFMKLVSGLIFALGLLYLFGGWWLRVRAAEKSGSLSPRRVLVFLVLSFAAVTFPANVVMKISEMYLCGLVVSVALLFAFAADGWNRRLGANAVASWTIVLALAITSGFAIWHKVTGMLQMGELAKVQADGLAAIVNAAPDAKRVKILYRKDQLEPRPTFSSYKLADCYLIRPTAAWVLFPGRDVLIDCVPPLPDERAVRAVERSDADIVLYWDVWTQRYERLK